MHCLVEFLIVVQSLEMSESRGATVTVKVKLVLRDIHSGTSEMH